MDSPKKPRITTEDRLSTLPDELLHKILKSVDTKLSVQTSILSKRWKLIWTTLPFLDIKFEQCKFIRHVFSLRNHHSHLSKLNIMFYPGSSFQEFVEYAISHNVQHLNLTLGFANEPCKLSSFSSTTLSKLTLNMNFPEFAVDLLDCWDLPALTKLHLIHSISGSSNLLEHCLTCLPALRTLRLTFWDLRESSFSFNLPALTSLYLVSCKLPTKVWNLPALKRLTISLEEFPEYMSEIFPTLVSLEYLTLRFSSLPVQDFFINCPQLVSLEINSRYNGTVNRNIVVCAPKLSNFTAVGIFPISFGVSKLDYVNIKLWDWIDHTIDPDELKVCYHQFTIMLQGLGNAKIVKLDLETIEALSLISNYLASFPSPFYSLKYVKIPQGCKEESISATLRNYLLGGSPAATIVTTLPQNMIPHTTGAYATSKNVLIQEPLSAPTKVLVDSQNIHNTVCVDTEDMEVEKKNVVHESEVHTDKVKHVGAPVEGTDSDWVTYSSRVCDFGLWRGHEVNFEFVCLLDLIMNKYPETFEHFTTKNKKLCTMKLNMLCTSVNDFTKISIAEVDAEIIAEYRAVFANLQKFGFNLSWLVSRLNYVEQLWFSQPLLSELLSIECRISDTKIKLQDLQSLRVEKMQEIHKTFGTMDTKLAAGYIGDNLFSGP